MYVNLFHSLPSAQYSMLLAIRTFTKVLVCASVAAARVGAAVIEFWF